MRGAHVTTRIVCRHGFVPCVSTGQHVNAVYHRPCGHADSSPHPRALLAALFSPVSLDFFMRIALGLGSTRHSDPGPEGSVGRKGMSCERTFR